MSVFNYNICLNSMIDGTLQFNTDAFKIMLLDGTYVPDKRVHQYRANVTGEITANNYMAGGNTIYCTPTLDLSSDKEFIVFSDPVFPNVDNAIANAAVIYQDTGDANTDILVSYIGFDQPLVSTLGQFAVGISAQMYLQQV